VRAAVPPLGSTLAGMTTLVSGLDAFESKPTVKLLFNSRMPSSCSTRRP